MTRRRSYLIIVIAVTVCAFSWKTGHRINIVFIGDSITQGSKTENYSPGKFAGEYLATRKGVESVHVANMGKSGFTTVNFLPGYRTFNEVKSAADSLLQIKDGAVLIFSIMLGTNDSAIKGPAGAPVAPDDYRTNLKLITDSLLAAFPDCEIIINHPIWYSENTHNYSASYMQEGQQRILAYEKEIDKLVCLFGKSGNSRVHLGDTFAYDYFRKHYLTDFNHQTGPDGLYFLHPNADGDKALGKFWAKAIMKAIN